MEKKKVTALLIRTSIKKRVSYGTMGIDFVFRDLEGFDTHVRTFNLVSNTKKKGVSLNDFLPVIIGDSDCQDLRKNFSELKEEIMKNDHKFFDLELEDSFRVKKNGGKVWNIVSIKLSQTKNKEEIFKIAQLDLDKTQEKVPA
ncbi:MAG: hypothetical protein HN576_09540 [Bacteriovoracaceae bacterium]|nr:hypothetical protein [Bacteriovoracaceae bacterium]